MPKTSHGHMDHISAIPQHAAKRGLYGMDPATYYVPSHLPDLVRSVAQIYQTIDTTTESLGDIKVVSLSPGDTIQLPDGFFVKPFPTVHRVPSQGYIVYKNKRNLKEEYKNLPSKEVAELFRGGVDIHNVVTSPEIAYMGDTTFEVFESPPTPDLLKVKVLITEATYIEDEDGKDRVGQARERGHIHLAEIVNHEHLFKDINHIVLSHLSDKYSVSFAQNFIPGKLTASLKDKVQIATLARERTS